MTSIIRKIKPDFDAVIEYSQNIPNPQTQSLLEEWYKAKQHIIDKWNGQLIVESTYTITFDLSPEDKASRLSEFIETVSNVYCNSALANFLEETQEDFFNNHLSKDYVIQGIKVSKGTKVVKAFKYFESNERALYDLQTMASMIIQENRVRGTLCLSVHPLDFLSSSENTYHWRSCHSLDGDYRAGNLSYMLDSSTIICYLKSDSNLHKLPNFPESVPWNSKKWRMLLFLEDQVEALFAGRQYPFSSSIALEEVMDLFLSHWTNGAAKLSWSNWMDDYITSFPRANTSVLHHRDVDLTGGRNVMMGGRIYAMEDLVEDAKHSRHYNDLKYSSFYIPKYAWYYYPRSGGDRRLHFSIGKEVPCLCCNSTYVDREASMFCLDCGATLGDGEDDWYTYCGCCDRRVPREYTRWNNSIDDYVCNECYNTECRECEHCGDAWYTSQINYVNELNMYLCPCCNERYQRDNQLPRLTGGFINFEY